MDEITGGILGRTASRILFGGLFVFAFLLFVLWRTDNPRLQAVRAGVVDAAAPMLEAIAGPTSAVAGLGTDFRSFADLQAENQQLRQEVRRLAAWRDIAQQLEVENATLRALNDMKLPPRRSFVTAEVIADAGGPYAQSVIVNIGAGDGVADGAPALQENGLVGRVVGVGAQSARILLLTDPTSAAPVHVGEARARAILQGDNSETPGLRFLTAGQTVRRGDPVITSGDGGVYPAGILIGRVLSVDGPAPTVRLEADYRRLEFVKVQHSTDADGDALTSGLILRPASDAGRGEAPGAADPLRPEN